MARKRTQRPQGLPNILLLDADALVYACGFAAQTTGYNVIVELPDGEVEQQLFAPRDERTAGDQMKEYIKALPEGSEVLCKEKHYTIQPKENALHIAAQSLDTLYAAIKEKFPYTEVRSYLSSGPTFRDDIATIRPYKGNRDPANRPHHYDAIREYFLNRRSMTLVAGIEADDRISIEARELYRKGIPYVIASMDKDLDQIPGKHYNHRDGVWYDVDEADADATFYVQILSGDSTDNVGGCYKLGVVKAAKMIREWQAQHSEADIWQKIVEQYALSIEKYGEATGYADKTPDAVALENARLVKLLEYPGQQWMPNLGE